MFNFPVLSFRYLQLGISTFEVYKFDTLEVKV